MTNDRHIRVAVVTGAAGFIGRHLLVELTRQGTSVCALVRSPSARLPELRAWVDAHGGAGELVFAADFDLEAPDLGLTPEGEAWLERAEAVYHLAARFEFGLTPEVARAANVDASVRLVERLAGRPRLERLVYLSGYRTEGQPARALDVDDAAALRRFYRQHGAYEASKMEAHQRVARRADELGVPLTRVSPAVVIGHSETGETTQFIGLVETLRLLHARRLPALPGDSSTWLPLVTVDLVASVLARVPTDPHSRGEHLLVFDERSPALPELVKQAALRMGVSAPRLRLPVWFVRALPTALSGVDREGLSFISSDRYDATPMLAFVSRTQLAVPEIGKALDRWVDFLVANAFGAPAGATSPLTLVGGPARP
jgi:dihydroflavonol-4-reductase